MQGAAVTASVHDDTRETGTEQAFVVGTRNPSMGKVEVHGPFSFNPSVDLPTCIHFIPGIFIIHLFETRSLVRKDLELRFERRCDWARTRPVKGQSANPASGKFRRVQSPQSFGGTPFQEGFQK